MALTTINLQIQFTATYVGEHRICWRVAGTIPYDCTNTVIAILGVNTTVITFDVEENFCGPYFFEGYVQPTCVDEGDPSLQTAWTPVEYVNTPDCNAYTLTCSTVSIAKIDITGYGSGYDPTPGNEPLVTIAGDATAVAVVEATNDGIKTASINTPGAGYFGGGYGKAINITATTAGSGIDARFDVTVEAGVVVDIALRSGGTLWSLIDQFSFNNADLGGVGAGFLGDVKSLSVIGEIKEVQLTFVGTGYNSVPVLTIDPPVGPGTQATGLARLAGCQSITGALLGPNCDATLRSDIVSMPLNSVISFCNPAASPPLGGYPQGWTQADGTCCYLPCKCYEVTLDAGGTVEYYYTDCATGVLTYGTFTDAGPHVETITNVVEGTLQSVWLIGTGTQNEVACIT